MTATITRHADYGWIITKDVEPYDDGDGAVRSADGTMGPSDIDPAVTELKAGHGVEFRLRYGDPEDDSPEAHDVDTAYYGRYLEIDRDRGVIPADQSVELGFGPLDDFGIPNAGCTVLEYRETGRDGKTTWKVL